MIKTITAFVSYFPHHFGEEIANNSIVLHAKHVLAISHKTNDHYIAYKSTGKKNIPQRQAKSKKYTRSNKKKCVKKRVAKVCMWVGDV